MLGRNGFLARRWRGEVNTNLVLWRDMLGVGSLLNISISLLALRKGCRRAWLRRCTLRPCPTTCSCSS
jgi:hypothetical protein